MSLVDESGGRPSYSILYKKLVRRCLSRSDISEVQLLMCTEVPSVFQVRCASPQSGRPQPTPRTLCSNNACVSRKRARRRLLKPI
jgi:hypothetical protein